MVSTGFLSGSVFVKPGTIHIGNQLLVDDIGGLLAYRRNFEPGSRHLCVTFIVDDTGTTRKAAWAEFDARQNRAIQQPDNTGEIISDNFVISGVTSDDEFLFKFYNQIGSVAPTAAVNFKYYIGSIAEENLFVEIIKLAGDFAVDTEFFVELEPVLGVFAGETIIAVITSPDAFALKADVTNTDVWSAVDIQTATTVPLSNQFSRIIKESEIIPTTYFDNLATWEYQADKYNLLAVRSTIFKTTNTVDVVAHIRVVDFDHQDRVYFEDSSIPITSTNPVTWTIPQTATPFPTTPFRISIQGSASSGTVIRSNAIILDEEVR